MADATVYTRRNLELKAAEYYMSIRKQEDEWKFLADLGPQLNEFQHLIRAGDCIGAYQVLESISDYLSKWGQYAWLVKMREKLLEQKKIPVYRWITRALSPTQLPTVRIC